MPDGPLGSITVASMPMLIWRGIPGMNIYNVPVHSTSLESMYNYQQIHLNQGFDISDPHILGEYWKQTVVQVKLGVIPSGKLMLVNFLT